MKKHSGNEEELIEYIGKDTYKLLKWILNCKRCALLKVPDKKKLKCMQTDDQFLMLVDDPEKSSKFNKDREKYGSYFCFHGSGIENWHSILRNGIVNASNTKLMTTGAAYGAGVYAAADTGTSMGYAKTGNSWPKSKFKSCGSMKCMAILEVVKGPNIPTTPNPYYVITETKYITTRFFLFWPSSTSVNVQNTQITKELTNLI